MFFGYGRKGITASTYLKNPVPKQEKNLKSDESCISNPKSQLSNRTAHLRVVQPVQFQICDFGFEMQDSSDFKISPSGLLKYVVVGYHELWRPSDGIELAPLEVGFSFF
jgi:hypothetical protein